MNWRFWKRVPPERMGVCACGTRLGEIDGTIERAMCGPCRRIRSAANEFGRRTTTGLREALRPLRPAAVKSVTAALPCETCGAMVTVTAPLSDLWPSDAQSAPVALRHVLPEACVVCQIRQERREREEQREAEAAAVGREA